MTASPLVTQMDRSAGRSGTLTLKQSIDMLAATVNGCY